MDFDYLCGIAINRLHINVKDFYRLTPREFAHAIKDYNEINTLNYRTLYEVERFGLRHHWNMQGKFLKRGIKEDEKIQGFSWDKNKSTEAKNQTVDEMKHALQGIARYFKKDKDKKDKDGSGI